MIKENQKIFNRINIFTDICLLFVSMLLAYFIRFYILKGDLGHLTLGAYMQFTFVLIPIHLLLYGFFDLYSSFRSKPFIQECFLIIKANIALTIISLSGLFVLEIIDISRILIIVFLFISILLIIAKRFILRRTLSNLRSNGYNLKSVIILGAGKVAKEYLDVIKDTKTFGYHYVGYVANDGILKGAKLGNFSDLYAILNNYKPDEVVCAIDVKDAMSLENIVRNCELTGTKISIIPFLYQYIPTKPYYDQIKGIPLINIRRIPLDNMGNAFIKRVFDVVGSVCLLVLTSPIMLITSICVKLSSKGPIIFKQKRVGLNKELFIMYKFRSMRINNQQKTAWSRNTDPRKTKVGAFIRKYSIDELPQFYNVLKGDMSLVGPRPELPHFVENFKNDIPLYMVKHQVKPGITGLAQINGYRGDTSIKKRIEFDIEYIENWTLLLDIQILFKTAFKAFKNEEVN